MAFSEALKLNIKKKAHFACCMCKALGVEIHHIVPESENGPDTEDNAAPLCPSCHAAYGANPQRRRFIRELRDFWYEICANRYFLDTQQLHAISEALKGLASKEDLERLSVQNSAFVRGQSLTALVSSWEQLRYSFYRDEYIHPLIVMELLGWMSDSRATVTSIDLAAANRSNRFFGDFSVYNEDGRIWVQWRGDHNESFAYSYIATSPSGVQMVECHDSGGGSGIFAYILLLAFDCDRSLDTDNNETGIPTKERILLKTLGSICLGDRYSGKITYKDGLLAIGPDTGWFERGEKARKTIPIR